MFPCIGILVTSMYSVTVAEQRHSMAVSERNGSPQTRWHFQLLGALIVVLSLGVSKSTADADPSAPLAVCQAPETQDTAVSLFECRTLECIPAWGWWALELAHINVILAVLRRISPPPAMFMPSHNLPQPSLGV